MITGTTKVYYMLAHPISHVRTPELFNPICERRGIDAVMVAIHFGPEDFATGWAAMKKTRNLGGFVISVPFKEQALALSDEADETAVELGVANTVRREADGRMIAANFDGIGFLDGMLGGGADARGRSVLLVGAGGAGRAIALNLAKCGIRSLRIHDVAAERAQSLAAELATRFPGLDVVSGPNDLEGIDLLVNASPCGLHPQTDPIPVDVRALTSRTLVADIIMKPHETPLLKAARAAGCEVRYGAGMLDSQIESMMRFFGY